MPESIFNNGASSKSQSDSQSTADDLNSNNGSDGGESNSVGDQSIHSDSNKHQLYYLPWDYVDTSIKSCIKILIASFNFNNSTTTASVIQPFQHFSSGMKLSRPPFSTSMIQQKSSNFELQARSTISSSSFQQQQQPQQQPSKQFKQFQFNNKNPSPPSPSQQQIINQFNNKTIIKKDSNNSGFARQFPPTFIPEQQQQQQIYPSYFNSHQQAQMIAQYKQQHQQQNSFLQQQHDDYSSSSSSLSPFKNPFTNNQFQQQQQVSF